MRTRGEGVKNPGNFADFLYVWSLTHASSRGRDVKMLELRELASTAGEKISLGRGLLGDSVMSLGSARHPSSLLSIVISKSLFFTTAGAELDPLRRANGPECF